MEEVDCHCADLRAALVHAALKETDVVDEMRTQEGRQLLQTLETFVSDLGAALGSNFEAGTVRNAVTEAGANSCASITEARVDSMRICRHSECG